VFPRLSHCDGGQVRTLKYDRIVMFGGIDDRPGRKDKIERELQYLNLLQSEGNAASHIRTA
jgi:hypothetical protein